MSYETELTDDAAALRLASDLRMSIRFDDPWAVTCGWRSDQPAPTVDGRGPWYWKEWVRDHEDRASAMRASIVKAARSFMEMPDA